ARPAPERSGAHARPARGGADLAAVFGVRDLAVLRTAGAVSCAARVLGGRLVLRRGRARVRRLPCCAPDQGRPAVTGHALSPKSGPW
ncbi:hypothetical protein ACFCX5_09855, partial [Streptomyces sp. NPDC056304]